jgi:predicted nucleotide-binding protein (sugar kinase/HSP70/actin superfamily)
MRTCSSDLAAPHLLLKEIVERSGTLYFSFQDLDSTKPAGSVRIRIETIAHYLERKSAQIVRAKSARLGQ